MPYIMCNNCSPEGWDLDFTLLEVTEDLLLTIKRQMGACRHVNMGSTMRKLSVFSCDISVFTWGHVFDDEGLADEQAAELNAIEIGLLNDGCWVLVPDWLADRLLQKDACRIDCVMRECWSMGSEGKSEDFCWSFCPKYAEQPLDITTQRLSFHDIAELTAA